MSCLAEQTIAEYIEGRLDAVAADHAESHLDGCADCRLAVAEVARGRSLTETPSSQGEPAEPSLESVPQLVPGALVGRYVVRRIVGSGGMGIVYAAYDSKLDREIALKILRPEFKRFAEERLDREAKLMARLDHPNVITIYDVGSILGQAYVAMELVVGETLGQRLRRLPRRSWREVLALFVAAGRGLAAAHREGVVHRDFKPDNVLVGKDGRVRVTDFGLARTARRDGPAATEGMSENFSAAAASQLTRSGVILGTPAYMAPEQLRGNEADALSDQFGFCIALYEGLYGERPFGGATLAELEQAIDRGVVRTPRSAKGPAWLRRAVTRGLRSSPTERWPSMDALLDALEHAPAVRRRRWTVAGVVLAIALVAVGVTRMKPAERPCQGAAAQLTGVWDAPLRQAVQRAFTATGVPYADDAWRGVLRALDSYSQAWIRMHTEACEATRVRGEQSTELLDLRMHCLEKQRQELQALVAVYTHADAEAIKHATAAAPSPSSLRVCSDARELLQPTRQPTDPRVRTRIAALEQRLAGLRAQHRAGQYHAAKKAADAIVGDAVTLAYAPMTAEAHLLLGDIQQTLGEFAAAESSFYGALWTSEAGHQDRITAQAWTRLVHVVGYRQERASEAQRLVQHADAALLRLGDDAIERAALERAAGSVAYAQGQYQEAQRRFENGRVLLLKALGPDSLELGEVLQWLAITLEPLGDWRKAILLERRGLDIFEKQLGPEHPETADSRRRFAQHLFYNEFFEESLRMAQHALSTYERSYPTDSDHVASALIGVAEILLEIDRGQEALPLAARALDIRNRRRTPWHTDVAEALSKHSAALMQIGQTDAALAEGLRAKEIIAKALGSEHIRYAWVLSDLGRIHAARGEHRQAYEAHRESLRALSRSQIKDAWSTEKQRLEVGRAELALPDGKSALATLEQAIATLEREDGSTILLGDGYFQLAKALAFLKRDGERVHQLVQQAISVYRREQTARAPRIAAAERFLAQAAR